MNHEDSAAQRPHWSLTQGIIASCIAVHRSIGPGLLESAYQMCVALELQERCIPFLREVSTPLRYAGRVIEDAYRVDFIVDDAVVLELKTVTELLPVHDAQLLTYLRLTGKRVGLLINFNTAMLRSGVRRLML